MDEFNDENVAEKMDEKSEVKKSCKTEEYLCDTCEVVFTHLDKFMNHTTQEHRLPEDKINYDCAKCYKSFSTALQFRDHVGKVVNKCEFCDISFTWPYALKAHIHTVHEGHKDYKCSLCYKSYTDSKSLKLHIQSVHEGRKDHRCDSCKKSFSQKKHMRHHIREVHEGRKDYKCDSCGKLWSQKGSLNVHIRTVHNGEKEQCYICSNLFATKGSMMKHIKMVHEGIKDFKCRKCDKSFFKPAALNKHNTAIHEKAHSDLFKCDKCKRIFSLKGNLVYHITVIHEKENVPTCKICGFVYGSKTDLRKHMRQDHLLKKVKIKNLQSKHMSDHTNLVQSENDYKCVEEEHQQIKIDPINDVKNPIKIEDDETEDDEEEKEKKLKCLYEDENMSVDLEIENDDVNLEETEEQVIESPVKFEDDGLVKSKLSHSYEDMSLDLEVEEYDANNHKQQNVGNEQQIVKDLIKSDSNEQLFQYSDSDIAIDVENEGNNKRNHKHNELRNAGYPVEFVNDGLADEANFNIKDPVNLVDECNDHFDGNDDLEMDLSNEELKMIMNGHDQENEFKEKEIIEKLKQLDNNTIHIGQKVHKCDNCGKSFTHSGDLNRHINIKHGHMKDYKCKICGKLFGRNSNLNRHIHNIHENHRKYKCDSCSKSFHQGQQLKKHFHTIHAGNNDNKCELCEKSFFNARNLWRHIDTIHEGHKDCKCESCNNIRTIHASNKDYNSESCGKPFPQSVGLKRHIWTTHKSGMSEGSKQFKCKLCALTFSQAKYVIEHVKSVHKSRNDFKCDSCNKTHTDTSQLKIHQKMVHDTQICKYCYKKFTGVENTMMHINKVHGRRKIHKRQPNVNNKRQNRTVQEVCKGLKPIVLNKDKLNSIPEVTNDMSEAIPVHPESQFNRRGRPETSALKAEVDGIKDQTMRRRKLSNACSARFRRNQRQLQEEMEKNLFNETERNAKLTIKLEKLEKILKALRQRYFLIFSNVVRQ